MNKPASHDPVIDDVDSEGPGDSVSLRAESSALTPAEKPEAVLQSLIPRLEMHALLFTRDFINGPYTTFIQRTSQLQISIEEEHASGNEPLDRFNSFKGSFGDVNSVVEKFPPWVVRYKTDTLAVEHFMDALELIICAIVTQLLGRGDPGMLCEVQAGLSQARVFLHILCATIRVRFEHILEWVDSYLSKPLPQLPKEEIDVGIIKQSSSPLGDTSYSTPSDHSKDSILEAASTTSVVSTIDTLVDVDHDTRLMRPLLLVPEDNIPSDVGTTSTVQSSADVFHSSSSAAVGPRRREYAATLSVFYGDLPDVSEEIREALFVLATGESAVVYLDQAGKVTATSFNVLLRFLTTAEHLRHPGLEDVLFFAILSYIGNPHEFVEGLQSRLEVAKQLRKLNDTQAASIAARAAREIEQRVQHLLLRWLEEFWNPVYRDAICPIYDLVSYLDCLHLDLDAAKRLDEAKNRLGLEDNVRLNKLRSLDQQKLTKPLTSQITDFAYPDTPLGAALINLTDATLRELALQIAIFFRERYLPSNPEDFVHRFKPDAPPTEELRPEDIHSWLISSLYQCPTREERSKIVQSWLKIAAVSHSAGLFH
jgi:hypothetical protein